MSLKSIALTLVGAALVGAAGAYAFATRHGEIAAIAPPDPASFDGALVEQGAIVSGLGNCHVCHTAAGGAEYAGSLALPTPFGTIYTSNITPDPVAGIGAWSLEAFVRAMREGISRDGSHLYPAFPYDYYAKVTDADLEALYAYLMTRPADATAAPETALPFPFGFRPLMEGWNILHLEKGVFEPDPAQSETWNRGAYIVEGLGHCGACHTPRDAMGAAPKSGPDAYAGGYAEGWYAPPLTAATTAPIPWTEIALVNYLIDGWDRDHGIVAGPMKPVVNDLYEQSEDDVFAIAAYIMHLKGGEKPAAEQDAIVAEARARADKAEWGHPEAPQVPDDPQMAEGARIFEAQCATCHKAGGLPSPLGLGTSIWSDEPANLVRITFEGNTPGPLGSLDRSMPGRANQISDSEMAALAAFMRARFTDRPAWPAALVAQRIAEARADLAHKAAGGH